MNKELPKSVIIGLIVVLLALVGAGYAYFVKTTGQVFATQKYTTAELNALAGPHPTKKPGHASPKPAEGSTKTASEAAKPAESPTKAGSEPTKLDKAASSTDKPDSESTSKAL